jgi:hypothetical protein
MPFSYNKCWKCPPLRSSQRCTRRIMLVNTFCNVQVDVLSTVRWMLAWSSCSVCVDDLNTQYPWDAPIKRSLGGRKSGNRGGHNLFEMASRKQIPSKPWVSWLFEHPVVCRSSALLSTAIRRRMGEEVLIHIILNLALEGVKCFTFRLFYHLEKGLDTNKTALNHEINIKLCLSNSIKEKMKNLLWLRPVFIKLWSAESRWSAGGFGRNALQKLYQTLNKWKIEPYKSVLKLPLLADLQQKVGELVISIIYCPAFAVLENVLN